MMESINYKPVDLQKDAYILLKKYIIREKLESMIGEKIMVYIDRPIGSTHPNHSDIVYPINYGYIKEIVAVDGEYQDTYVLGENKVVTQCQGIIYAVVERKNDAEDKLVIFCDNREYSIEEIKETINFQEKFFKYKIIKEKRINN